MTIRFSRRSNPLLADLAQQPADASASADTPYLNARRTWNDQMGTLVSAKNIWQLIGSVSLVISLLAIAGLVYIGSQSHFVPYVVQVDKQGQTLAVGPIERAPSTDGRLIHAALAEFVGDFRVVTPDVQLQRKAIIRMYAHFAGNDPAVSKTNEFMASDLNPFKRAESEMVSIKIISVLPQTQETWQVDWEETTRDRNGNIKSSPVYYRALINVYVAPPTGDVDEDKLRNNPLGIYVRDFSFAPLPAFPR